MSPFLSYVRLPSFFSYCTRNSRLIDNKELCVLPLTSVDMLANPFRYHPNERRESLSLAHAVMALTCHHLGTRSRNCRQQLETVSQHYQTALHLFRQSINTDNIARNGQALLDTIVVLFSLDVSKN